MNLIIKRYKILIISFSMFFLIFNCFNVKKTYAFVGVDDALVVGGITVSTECVALLVGTTLIAGGVYLSENKDFDDIHYISKHLIDAGVATQNFAIRVGETGKNFLSWTKAGFDNFCDTLSNVMNDGITVPVEPNVNISVPNPFRDSDGYYHVSDLTLSPNASITNYWNTSVTNGSQTYTNKSSVTQHVQFLIRSYDAHYLVDGVALTGTAPYSGVRDFGYRVSGNSVCLRPVSDGVKSFNPSICVDNYINAGTGSAIDNIPYGVPLSVDSLEGGGVAYAPALDYPYERDWGSVVPDISIPKDTDGPIDVPSDSTGDITGSEGNWILNIPILGDILKVLLDILNAIKDFFKTLIDAILNILELLKNLVKTLIGALVSAITTLFVPSDTYFTDKFDGYRTTLIGKLGDNNFDFLQQSGSNIEDIYINIFGQQICIVKITLFNKFKDFAFIVIRAFFYFFLILFNFNQVIKFLRGSIFSDYNSRESMAILQNNDNLDKIINNV